MSATSTHAGHRARHERQLRASQDLVLEHGTVLLRTGRSCRLVVHAIVADEDVTCKACIRIRCGYKEASA